MYGHMLFTKSIPSVILLTLGIQILVQNLAVALCSSAFVLAFLRFYRLPKSASAVSSFAAADKSASKDNGVEDKHFVIGHRGAGLDAPENTLAAIKLAKSCGAQGVEVDLAMTKDGVAVLLHDDTVDRTTDGKGRISDYSLCDARKLNAAHYFEGNRYSFEKIPTLEEAVQECIKLDLMLIIDVKSLSQQAVKVLVGLYHRNPQLYKNGVVSSFFPQVIYKVKRADSKIKTSLAYHSHLLEKRGDGSIRNEELWKRVVAPAGDIVYEWAIYSVLWFFCGISHVVAYKNMVSRDFVDYWRRRGIEVIPWGVNTEDEKRFFGNTLGISYMTDIMEGINSEF